MTPDFALSLSFDGIRLLQRSPSGWTPLGEVPLDSENLGRDLAALRQKGEAQEAAWRGTKLLLPADQIRTLSLEGEVEEAVVLAALDGLTPYAVGDLVVDHLRVGGRTWIAAVARETLEEAEAFASEHGFRPVAFAAEAPDDAFPFEPFFGPTRRAASLLGGEPVLREPLRVEPAAAPPADPVALPEVVEPADAPAPIAVEEPVAPASTKPASTADGAPMPLAVEPAPESLTAPAGLGESDASPASEPPAHVAETAEATSVAVQPDVASEPPADAAPALPDPIFASRPRPLRGESRLAEPVIPAPPVRPEPKPAAGWALAAPAGAARRVPPPPAAVIPLPSRPAAEPERATPPAEPPRVAAAVTTPAARVPGKPFSEAERLTVFGARKEPRRPQPAPVRGKPRRLGAILVVVALILIAAAGVFASVLNPGLLAVFDRSASAPVETADMPPPLAPDAMTVAPDAAAPATEAEPLAPASTAAPELDVAAQDLAATAPVDAEPAAGPSSPSPETLASAAAAVASAMASQPDEAPAAAEATAESGTSLSGSGAPLTPEEADRFYAATGVWLRPPRLPLLSQGEDLGLEMASTSSMGSDKLAPPPTLATPAPEVAPGAQVVPPPPGASSSGDERGLILATADGTVAPSGVRIVAGPPSLIPPTRPDTAAVESAAMPDDGASAWINAMAAPPGRTPPAVRPAAPEGLGVAAAETPTSTEPAAAWINAMAEPPSVFPPPRPETPAEVLAALGPAEAAAEEGQGPAAATATPGAVSLAAFGGPRPGLRPGDIAPEAPPETLAAFEGPRPDMRPDDLAPELPEAPDGGDALAEATEPAPEAPAAPAAPDLQSTLAAIVQGAPDPLAGATAQAVASARIPDGRPRNFDRVVREQMERVAAARARASDGGGARPSSGGGVGTGNLASNEVAEAGEAEAVSGAAAQPNGPVTATVAQAATFQDAMALREVNLIGVYGQPGARRALVRMGNGRYLRVSVGDSLDGGQVTAIGDNALNYVRRGQTELLVIPGG